MIREFDINSIFEKVFGYNPKPYHIEDASAPQAIYNNGSFSKDNIQAYKQPSQSSFQKGLAPYFDIYQDQRADGSVSGGREIFLPVWLDDYMLSFAVVEVGTQKNIVETVMVHRDGTVKELISTQDYKIGIKGIIVREDGLYPEQEMQTLKTVYEGNQAVTIKNVITDIFLQNLDEEETKVVIKDLKFPGTIGVMNAKAYEMSLISDRAFKLYII